MVSQLRLNGSHTAMTRETEGSEMEKLTTKRVIQLSNLADDFSSRARVCFRGGANLKKIGNNKGAHYLFYRAVRFQRIALNAASRLEVCA